MTDKVHINEKNKETKSINCEKSSDKTSEEGPASIDSTEKWLVSVHIMQF